MLFDKFGGLLENNFSSFEFSDDQGNYIFAETRVNGLLPERTVSRKKTVKNVKNVTINNYYGKDSHNKKVAKNNGGNHSGSKFTDEYDTVETHKNNLEKVIGDYIISRSKMGYELRARKNVGKNDVMVTTGDNRGRTHATLFKVYY